MPGTIVFIPALNEEDNLPAVLAELRAELPGTDVLVVDDGSTDRTADVARAEGAQVLSFGENRGLREGIAAGYRYAEEHGYDFGGRVDADGQHPVVELRRLLALVQAGRVRCRDRVPLRDRRGVRGVSVRALAESPLGNRCPATFAPRACWAIRSTTPRAGCTP